MNITSFLIDDADGKDVVTTYLSSASRHHYICLHVITETDTSGTVVKDGEVTFAELLIHIGPFRKEWVICGSHREPWLRKAHRQPWMKVRGMAFDVCNALRRTKNRMHNRLHYKWKSLKWRITGKPDIPF